MHSVMKMFGSDNIKKCHGLVIVLINDSRQRLKIYTLGNQKAKILVLSSRNQQDIKMFKFECYYLLNNF